MSSDERTSYFISGSGTEPEDKARLDVVRGILADEGTWAEPPPEVGANVLDAIRREAMSDVSAPPRPRWPRLAAAVVGAAAVVILVVSLVAVLSSPDEQLLAIEGTELVPAATGEAAIRETGSGWYVRIDLTGLPAAAEGTYYEGWMWSPDGDGVSIGTFHMRGGDEAVTLWSGVDPADYPSIWITLEDEDGDPTASDRVVMWGRAEP